MKTCLVGYTPDESGEDALHFARTLARNQNLELVVCIVVPETWDEGRPSLATFDREYAAFVDNHASQALAQARQRLDGLPNVRYVRQVAHSAPQGLADAALQADAGLIVIGSARAGAPGRISLGGVASDLVHLSEVPVAIAPRAYAEQPEAPLQRLTCAYSGLDAAAETVRSALRLAGAIGTPLRLASFAVSDRQLMPVAIEHGSEDVLLQAWREQALAAQERMRQQVADSRVTVTGDVAIGDSWDEALHHIDWLPGEVMVLGSSRMGLLQRVFLGSNALKIVQASPVPVIVLPRVS